MADPQFPRGSAKPRVLGTNLLLPPATKLGQGYIFTGICHSVNGGEYLTRQTPPGPGTPPTPTPQQTPPPQVRTPPRSDDPPGQTPPRSDTPGQTPPGLSTPPGTKYTPLGLSTPTRIKYTPLRYGQHAGSMHPTGMQTCFA